MNSDFYSDLIPFHLFSWLDPRSFPNFSHRIITTFIYITSWGYKIWRIKNDFNKTECIEHSPDLFQDLHTQVSAPACPLFFPLLHNHFNPLTLFLHFPTQTNNPMHSPIILPILNLFLCSFAYFLQLPTLSPIPLIFLSHLSAFPFPVIFLALATPFST